MEYECTSSANCSYEVPYLTSNCTTNEDQAVKYPSPRGTLHFQTSMLSICVSIFYHLSEKNDNAHNPDTSGRYIHVIFKNLSLYIAILLSNLIYMAASCEVSQLPTMCICCEVLFHHRSQVSGITD